MGPLIHNNMTITGLGLKPFFLKQRAEREQQRQSHTSNDDLSLLMGADDGQRGFARLELGRAGSKQHREV